MLYFPLKVKCFFVLLTKINTVLCSDHNSSLEEADFGPRLQPNTRGLGGLLEPIALRALAPWGSRDGGWGLNLLNCEPH